MDKPKKETMTGVFTMTADNVELVVHNPPEKKDETTVKTEKDNG